MSIAMLFSMQLFPKLQVQAKQTCYTVFQARFHFLMQQLSALQLLWSFVCYKIVDCLKKEANSPLQFLYQAKIYKIIQTNKTDVSFSFPWISFAVLICSLIFLRVEFIVAAQRECDWSDRWFITRHRYCSVKQLSKRSCFSGSSSVTIPPLQS